MTPEWIDPGNGDGRQIDLTGMRLAAQTIEDELLDGITTITPRPRYLALRCWVIARYWAARQPNDWDSYIEFAARQECAFSLGLAAKGYKGPSIVGIEKAQTIAGEGRKVLPITRHTAQTAATIYLSSSEDLGLSLTMSETGVPALTPNGEALAQIAERTLGNTRYGRALRRNPGLSNAKRDDLVEFASAFDPDLPEREEAKIILEGMLARNFDQPALFRRRSTYGLLLECCSSLPELGAGDFFDVVVDGASCFSTRFAQTADAWAEYCVRDMLAVVHERAVQSVAAALNRRTEIETSSDPDAVLLDAVAQSDNMALFNDLGFEAAGKMTVGMLRDEIARRCSKGLRVRSGMRRWSGGLTESAVISTVDSLPSCGPAALAIGWCLAAHRAAGLTDGRSDERHGAGASMTDILPLLDAMAAAPVRKLMAELTQRAAMRHLRVAWQRLALDPTRNVALFSVDEGRWIFFRSYAYRRMNTRVIFALRWLRFLGAVNGKGLTKLGRALLAEVLADDMADAA
jgi:hypothetical protein